MNNRVKKFLKLILILIMIIFFIKMFFLNGLLQMQNIDDFLFLKLLSKGSLNGSSNESSNKNKYQFRVSYKNINFKKINLLETIDKDTLLYEKIAPGTRGSFNIVLDSNQSLKYRIEFQSINEKPQNLKFEALKDGELLKKSNTLEELSKSLKGDKNQKINITINWYWNFESLNNQEVVDIQDTRDAENIKRYEFSICTFGE